MSDTQVRPSVAPPLAAPSEPSAGAVFVMTNARERNEVLSFRRDAEGRLEGGTAYATGGKGSGRPHLSSQGSVVLAEDHRLLLVINPGSNELSVFLVDGAALELRGLVATGGHHLVSAAIRGDLVYVLHKGDDEVGDVRAFRLTAAGELMAVDGSRRHLSAADSNPAQVGISPDGRILVVTEEATNMIGTWPLGDDGLPGAGTFSDSARATPFGFAFTADSTLIVANAERGQAGAASVSSYRLTPEGADVISGAVSDLRSEVCWTILSRDEQFAFVTNFGDGTISSYSISSDGMIALEESVAATTTLNAPSVRDAGLSADGRFLYAIDVAVGAVFGWQAVGGGVLVALPAVDGLPPAAAGLAAY